MKRIAGSMLLLAGLGGCISPSGNSVQGEKKTADARSSMTIPAANGFNANPSAPSNNVWSPQSDQRLASRSTDAMAPARAAADPSGPPTSVPPPAAQASAGLPQSIVPVVTTPGAKGSAPAAFPAGVAAAAMPPAGSDQSLKTVSATQPADPLATAPKGDAITPPVEHSLPSLPLPDATPAVPKKDAADAEAARAGSPLMRVVNTKRITLNFEVKDVGPFGLANVELWYTQNCRDWKKYDAPKNSKAYVVEVDEEGMYGFTLVARSGLGLGKEPPVSGDQPQVWTIVDVTPPAVKLNEIVPVRDSKQVTITWKASDKNFSRTPIALSYAETEAGPWRSIASGLENTGKYNWQMPAGTPHRFLVRIEATDLAGNSSSSVSSKPMQLDTTKPTVSITNVEANASH